MARTAHIGERSICCCSAGRECCTEWQVTCNWHADASARGVSCLQQVYMRHTMLTEQWLQVLLWPSILILAPGQVCIGWQHSMPDCLILHTVDICGNGPLPNMPEKSLRSQNHGFICATYTVVVRRSRALKVGSSWQVPCGIPSPLCHSDRIACVAIGGQCSRAA